MKKLRKDKKILLTIVIYTCAVLTILFLSYGGLMNTPLNEAIKSISKVFYG